jgi:hypothetical protein
MFVGTIWSDVTAERHIRPEFVSHHVQDSATLIAARQNHAIEYAQQILESPITAQTGRQPTLEEFDFDGARRVYGLARFAETAAGPISLWFGLEKHAVSANAERDFARYVLAVVGLLTFILMRARAAHLRLHRISPLSEAPRRLEQADSMVCDGLEHARDELGHPAHSFDDTAWLLEAKKRQFARAIRAVEVLSTWNLALVAPRDEASLIESMCRVIVETGGYRGAWVGLAKSDEKKTLEPAGCWNLDPQFLSSLGLTWADTPRGRGPAGTAIRRGTAVIVNGYMTDPDTAPWREKALRHHFNSVISLPLKVDGAVIGALTIHAAASDSFGEREVVLLTEVAAALSSGIAVVRAPA